MPQRNRADQASTAPRPREQPREASAEFPCPVCRGDDKCAVTGDGLTMCGRKSGKVPGFRSLGPAEGDPYFHLFRPAAGGTVDMGPHDAGPRLPGIVVDWSQEVATYIHRRAVGQEGEAAGGRPRRPPVDPVAARRRLQHRTQLLDDARIRRLRHSGRDLPARS